MFEGRKATYEVSMDELETIYGDVRGMSLATLCGLLADGQVGQLVQAS